jgi:hypothetical protein
MRPFPVATSRCHDIFGGRFFAFHYPFLPKFAYGGPRTPRTDYHNNFEDDCILPFFHYNLGASESSHLGCLGGQPGKLAMGACVSKPAGVEDSEISSKRREVLLMIFWKKDRRELDLNANKRLCLRQRRVLVNGAVAGCIPSWRLNDRSMVLLGLGRYREARFRGKCLGKSMHFLAGLLPSLGVHYARAVLSMLVRLSNRRGASCL